MSPDEGTGGKSIQLPGGGREGMEDPGGGFARPGQEMGDIPSAHTGLVRISHMVTAYYE